MSHSIYNDTIELQYEMKGLKKSESVTLLGLDDIAIKCPMSFMEFPFFHPSKEPIIGEKRWEYWSKSIHTKLPIRINFSPTRSGRPTLYDLRLIIFITSQLAILLDRGICSHRIVRFHPNKYFSFTREGSGMNRYDALLKSLHRLQGTSIETNIVSGRYETVKAVSLVDEFEYERNVKSRRLRYIDLKLSDWLLSEMSGKSIKTLDSIYFRIKSPFVARLYLIFMKHVGKSGHWSIGVGKLYLKHGSGDELRVFRFKLKKLSGDVPGFHFAINSRQILSVTRRRLLV